jgi:catechol 2,3-dioxygenase-like lactoylglutathione lyase family enzyme
MGADLHHIVVHATDPLASAEFLAAILELAVRPARGPSVPVQATNGVTLNFIRDDAPFSEQHCAFLVSDDAFDAGLRRLRDVHACIWSDPRRRIPDAITHHADGRGLYFDDPDGHLVGLLTTATAMYRPSVNQ